MIINMTRSSKQKCIVQLTVAVSLAIVSVMGVPPAIAMESAPTIADQGEQLYRDNCATCHGQRGMGGVGIPIGLKSFLQQTPDEYLHRTIRVGRPGRIMPSFYRLSNDEIKSIIKHIRSWHETDVPQWHAERIRADVERGKRLYQTYCISCHGKEGKGGKGTGLMFSRPRDLPIVPPALNNQGFLNSVSDQMLKAIITQGREQTPMPAASEFNLSETDVDDLVSYIRSFQVTLMTGEKILDESPVLVFNSKHTFEKTLENIKKAVEKQKYHLVEDEIFNQVKAPVTADSKTRTMVYFCNFETIYDALAIDPRIGMFLPCRITVSEHNGRIQAMSINPRRLSQLFNNDELDLACERMHDTYSAIMKEATQ